MSDIVPIDSSDDKYLIIWKRTYYILSGLCLFLVVYSGMFLDVIHIESPLIPAYTSEYAAGFVFYKNVVFFFGLGIGQIFMTFNLARIATIFLIAAIVITILYGQDISVYFVRFAPYQ